VGQQIGQDLHLIYLAVAFVCGGFALWAILKMGKVYESSLLNWRLKRRQRVSDTLIGKISKL
jgi:ATP:ADP antiporter, AAA family